MAELDNLIEKVLASPRLPTLPTAAMQLIDQAQQDDVQIEDISQTIMLDPAISSKILKTVNSSFYGQYKTISSIQQAVIVLGLNSVKTLAMGFSLVDNLTGAGGDAIDLMQLWRRSLFSATAAKRLCEQLNVIQMEEVFLAALLQDLGVLALSQVLGEKYRDIYDQAEGDHRKLSGLERETLGYDHAEIGQAMAAFWGLPPLLVAPIQFHEQPERAPEQLRQIVRIVACSAISADFLMHPEDSDRASAYIDYMQEYFSIDSERAHELLGDFHRESVDLKRHFELPAGELGDPEVILSKARDVIEQLTLSTVAKAQKLERDNLELREQAYTDPLTAVHNRRGFDERVIEEFVKAEAAKPLTLMFLDIDFFKRFNDEHGHHVGDEALKRFALTLTETVGSQGLVFRFGGEEFAILCPGLCRKQAALLAEKIRVAVVDNPVSSEQGKALPMSTSIGVAVYEGTIYRRYEQLIQAADSSVYAAKGAGRNCVRVFIPRSTADNQAA